MNFAVISTGAPDTPPDALAKCVDSVRHQRLGPDDRVRHVVLCNPRPHFANLLLDREEAPCASP